MLVVTEPIPAEMSAVLLDVGGVLLIPDPTLLAEIFAPYVGRIEPAAVVRAHYLAMTRADDGVDHRWEAYREELAVACGVPAGQAAAAAAAHRERSRDADLWTWPIPGARAALGALGRLCRLGIVSNAEGTVEAKLARAGMAQVGAGAGVPVEIIVDSHLVGVRKPDPAIFAIALDAMGLQPERTAYVGDTRFADVVGAAAVGLWPIHLDPYSDCPAPAGHAHSADLAAVPAVLARAAGDGPVRS